MLGSSLNNFKLDPFWGGNIVASSKFSKLEGERRTDNGEVWGTEWIAKQRFW